VTITRHFQGWETASLPAATALLTHNWVQSGCTGPLDLRNSLLLVPTRHAGRRLRGELARVAADQGTAVLAGTIVTPEHLVPQSPNAASDDLLLALLAQQLRTRHADFTALLPNQQDASWNFPFALGIATQLQEVRRQLNEACLTASELIPKVPEEEQARWQDIARLEQGLIQDLEQHGLQDPLQARLEAEQQVPAVFPYDRILSLFIPDLSERTVRTLKTLSELCDVELHILAPEAEADRFDEWGRPRPDAWEGRPLPIRKTRLWSTSRAKMKPNLWPDGWPKRKTTIWLWPCAPPIRRRLWHWPDACSHRAGSCIYPMVSRCLPRPPGNC